MPGKTCFRVRKDLAFASTYCRHNLPWLLRTSATCAPQQKSPHPTDLSTIPCLKKFSVTMK